MVLFDRSKQFKHNERQRPSLAAVLMTSILFFGPAIAAADYDAAVKALETGNYSEAMSGFADEAQRGNIQAQWRLGEMYRLGHGTTIDPVQAIKWLTLAYVGGMRDETTDTLEMLRASVAEAQVVEAEQAALKWLEETNRVVFADDDTDALYQGW